MKPSDDAWVSELSGQLLVSSHLIAARDEITICSAAVVWDLENYAKGD
jgi:hypothetical protein